MRASPPWPIPIYDQAHDACPGSHGFDRKRHEFDRKKRGNWGLSLELHRKRARHGRALERIFNHLGVPAIYAQAHAGLKLVLYYFLGVNGFLRPTPWA